MPHPNNSDRTNTFPRRRPNCLPAGRERTRTRPGRTILAGALGCLLATACGTSTIPTAPPSPSPTPTGIQIAPELLGPLTMLGACGPVEDPGVEADVPGLELPAEAFATEVTEQNGLVTVQGYVALTPLLFQLHYREREDLEMLTVEHEIQESETLFSDGSHRVFLKAAAVCEMGSVFIANVVAEEQATAVPTPTGPPT